MTITGDDDQQEPLSALANLAERTPGTTPVDVDPAALDPAVEGPFNAACAADWTMYQGIQRFLETAATAARATGGGDLFDQVDAIERACQAVEMTLRVARRCTLMMLEQEAL